MPKLKIGIVPVHFEFAGETFPGFIEGIKHRLEEIIIKKLGEFGKVVSPGLICNTGQAKRAREFYIKNDIDIFIVIELGYTTSNIPYDSIKGINKPVIIFNTALVKNVAKDLDYGKLSFDDGVVGATEFASVLKRIGYCDYYIVSGLMDEDKTYKKIENIIRKVTNEHKNRDAGRKEEAFPEDRKGSPMYKRDQA